MKACLKNLFIVVTALILASCAGVPMMSKTDLPAGEVLFQNREYAKAAREFHEQSRNATNTDRDILLLRAAAAYAYTDQSLLARQILAGITQAPQNIASTDLRRLAESHIAINDRDAEGVLRLLARPFSPTLPDYYLAEYHDLRGTAFSMLGQRVETAQALTEREKYLRDEQQIISNQHRIWDALGMLSERSLKQMQSTPAPDVLGGWMELVKLAKQFQLNPDQLKLALARWQQRYPAHPIHPQILESLQNRKLEDVRIPEQVAVLLPLEGRIGAAARAIHDGIIAAYYARDKKITPDLKLKIYNTDDSIEGAQTAYSQAVAEGAGFVIGPLDKDAIVFLSQNNMLSVPTLALNLIPELENIPANLYQFGLLPEEEAEQVAERAWLDGHVNAAVLTPEGSWGDRVYQAFLRRWEQLGGRILEQQSFKPTDNDFSMPIQALLNVDESERRYRAITGLLGEKPKFTSRRRDDVDFIFLAANPNQARQIRPQLKFYHASGVPVYATSHLYSGNLTPERDRDMDGIRFGDMPWVLAESTSHRGLRSEIESLISKSGNQFQRLYALGVDAFNVVPALNTLKAYPYERFQGETGSLSLDQGQHIKRQLTWVYFRSGRPAILEKAGLQ